jgi:hypothetical protein
VMTITYSVIVVPLRYSRPFTYIGRHHFLRESLHTFAG